MKSKTSLFVTLATLVLLMLAVRLPVAVPADNPASPSGETAEARNARMKWWREARFGMFIHWGLYAVPAGTYHERQIPGIGEWIMNAAEIPVDEYAGYAKDFTASEFNADAWVKLAKEAGMKYLVITTKHHDGFAMYDSQVSDYNVMKATPFKRDPIAELAKACQAHDLKLGFYYSQSQDWKHPGGAIYNKQAWDAKQKGDYDDYLRKVALPQVHEILTKYGPVAVLWWDTPEAMTPERCAPFQEELKRQPQIVTNNRLGIGGDTRTPEQTIPPRGFPGHDWETCMTINDTWGYKSFDTNFKSTETLLRNLIDIASKGGNYLLNIGPDARGVIPQPEIDCLKEMGKWLQANGEAIYGTSASPFPKKLPWGRCTRRDATLYLHVFHWPSDGKLQVPLSNAKVSAHLLAAPQTPLTCTANDQGLTIALPAAPLDPIATVIVLKPEGPLQFIETRPADQPATGPLVLKAADAEIVGETIRLSKAAGEPHLSHWTNFEEFPEWAANMTRPGTYEVRITYAVPESRAGTPFTFAANQLQVTGKTENTGDWKTFRPVSLGTLKIDKPGPCTFTLKATAESEGVMNLRSIELVPQDASKSH